MVIMITNEKIKCYNCGEEISKEEGFKYKDGYLCECCYYDDFFCCEDCGALTPLVDSRTINPHLETKKYVCPSCSQNYEYCNHCDSLISHSEVWASDSDNVICNRCSSWYVICRDCHCIEDIGIGISVNRNRIHLGVFF